IRHAASVRPEPGSNSPIKMVKFNLCSYLTELITFKKLPALLLFSFQSSGCRFSDSLFILSHGRMLVNKKFKNFYPRTM
ncbi:MAG: hypothetical protein ACE3NC_06955, partial [Candidatus Wallacebacter cryptica]